MILEDEEMQIADITKKMIAYSEGNTKDINNFLKVGSLDRKIGKNVGVNARKKEIKENEAN